MLLFFQSSAVANFQSPPLLLLPLLHSTPRTGINYLSANYLIQKRRFTYLSRALKRHFFSFLCRSIHHLIAGGGGEEISDRIWSLSSSAAAAAVTMSHSFLHCRCEYGSSNSPHKKGELMHGRNCCLWTQHSHLVTGWWWVFFFLPRPSDLPNWWLFVQFEFLSF